MILTPRPTNTVLYMLKLRAERQTRHSKDLGVWRTRCRARHQPRKIVFVLPDQTGFTAHFNVYAAESHFFWGPILGPMHPNFDSRAFDSPARTLLFFLHVKLQIKRYCL